jgi:hypothetical protein
MIAGKAKKVQLPPLTKMQKFKNCMCLPFQSSCCKRRKVQAMETEMEGEKPKWWEKVFCCCGCCRRCTKKGREQEKMKKASFK